MGDNDRTACRYCRVVSSVIRLLNEDTLKLGRRRSVSTSSGGRDDESAEKYSAERGSILIDVFTMLVFSFIMFCC